MSIQGSVNQLLGITAAAAKLGTDMAAKSYAEKRQADYQTSFEAQKNAIAAKYTKSGALSKSQKAKETALAAEQAQPGKGSKAPWNKATEKKLAADYEAKMQGLQAAEKKGVAELKNKTAQAKEYTAKQFGDYKELSPKFLSMMSPEDRWKIKANEKLMQKDAFNKFVDTISKQGEKK